VRCSTLTRYLRIGIMISAPLAAAASVLDRVLNLASALYPQIQTANISANIAENAGRFNVADQTLRGGDQVVIGYDSLQTPVLALAGPSGVIVTPVQAASLTSGGVSAGLYPVGSALYAIPPAGQLSIFDQAADRVLLSNARSSYMTRIDGTITNTISAMYPPAIGQIAAIELDSRVFNFGAIGSTVLGAVNSGEIVTRIQVYTGNNAFDMNGLGLARLSKGPNITSYIASTDLTSVMSNDIMQLGGNTAASLMAVNGAFNSTEVTGRVSNIITGVNGSVAGIVTTALGAVNGGFIGSAE